MEDVSIRESRVNGVWELSVLFLQLSWKSKPISKQKVNLKMSCWEIAFNERPRKEEGARPVGRQVL